MSAATLAICVATYRRPGLLHGLLESLVTAERPAGVRLELRVVDNDASCSAEQVVCGFRDALGPDNVRYACVAGPNVAAVRNRALDMGPATWVAFVDDDEQVDPSWLLELLAALERSGADAVFGPVERELPTDAPDWIRRGEFFASSTPPTPLPWTRARTGNALVRGSWIYTRGVRFDLDYGTTGGEDSEFFARLQALGARLSWAPNARVFEPVAPARLRTGWLVQRAYWGGVHLQRLRHFDPRGDVPAPIRAAARAARGVLTCVAGVPSLVLGRPERAVRGLQSLALAAGGVAAWVSPRRASQREAYPSETVPVGE